MKFAFRWMNCFLLRELPLRAVVRLWDACLAEEGGFETFQTCARAARARQRGAARSSVSGM